MPLMNRRDFLFTALGATCAFAAGCKPRLGAAADKAPAHGNATKTHPALYWRARAQTVECELCPHGCAIEPGTTGFCRTRRNENGKLVSLTYGQPVISHNDPIEKKPLNHVLPGSKSFSLATAGCNLTCQHCQNWELSQASPGDLPPYDWSPAEVARLAKEAGSPTIAFTYNEPSIWPEYVLDVAAAAKPLGVRTVVISNGYIREKPQRELARVLTAYKIDMKGFSDKFYRDVCGGRRQPVLDGMVRIREENCWLEIVNLVIPTLNDDPGEIKQFAVWVRDSLGPDVPVHFTAFHPMYRLRNLPRTPVETLEKARQIALDAGLHYPYVGNVAGHPGSHTYCPNCHTVVIERVAMSSRLVGLADGKCTKCGAAIPGVWT